MPEHVRAGAGRRDNIPRCILKNFDRMFGDGVGVFSQARVEGRLSAAGLLAGEIHTYAEAVKNVHDGLTRLREEGIDEAGDEKLDGGHLSILSLVAIPCNPKTKTMRPTRQPSQARCLVFWTADFSPQCKAD